jgi:putative hemolysin
MSTNKRITVIIILMWAAVLMAACQPGTNGSNDEPAAVANPASVYCVELGYQLEIRQTGGGEAGVCIFPEGEECPEWDFLGGRCGQAYSFCQQNSGVLLNNDTNVATCVFPDESTCDEFAFSQGECQRGQNPPDGE